MFGTLYLPYLEVCGRGRHRSGWESSFLNFTTLPLDDGRFLVERGPTIHLASTERQLVVDAATPARKGSLVLIGDPAFDASLDGFAMGSVIARASPTESPGESDSHRGGADCADFQSLHFRKLLNAGEELDAIGAARGIVRPLPRSGPARQMGPPQPRQPLRMLCLVAGYPLCHPWFLPRRGLRVCLRGRCISPLR